MLRLQSDERLVALTRRGNQHAYEALIARYESRLLAFCRHMLGSREDAEDVLQEVFAAAYNALLADEREINVRPWLYRIARNRSLNHLRRAQAIGVDSMDVHFAAHGRTAADEAQGREDFRLLLADMGELAETQRTALVLRELDALSYEQIAEAMETTVPSVKSLLVRARVSLAEAAEARTMSCDEVRLELGEVAEGLKRMSPPVRRHLKQCERCAGFREQLRETNKALAAMFPVGPLLLLKKLLITHLGASTASGAAATGGGAGATAMGTVAAGGAAGSALSAGATAIAGKAAAGLAAAAIVTAGAVEVRHAAVPVVRHTPAAVVPARTAPPATVAAVPRTVPAAPKVVERKPQPTTGQKPAATEPTPVATTPAPATDPATTTPTTTDPAAGAPTQDASDTTTLPSQPPPDDSSPEPDPSAPPPSDPGTTPPPSDPGTTPPPDGSQPTDPATVTPPPA